MPYTAYAKMVPQDVVDLKLFMDGLPAATTPNLPHEVGFPFNIRRTLGGWKFLFAGGDYVITGDLTPEVERGRYIAESLAHCGECHTPRNGLGGLTTSRWLSGATMPDGKGKVPNITPAVLTWSADDVFAYLTTGFTPEFDVVGGAMAHVVENMARLPESDVRAVVAYLQSVPAVP
jgi:mono/diheme cytochrome c family protein